MKPKSLASPSLPSISFVSNMQSWKWFLLLCFILSRRTLGTLQTSQYNALRGIYDSTGGPEWNVGQNVPWDFSNDYSDPCVDNWLGQFCLKLQYFV